jgi:hypothetical protein
MEDKLKSVTMWMACDKIRNCLTLEVCPQWSKRQLIEWMENSICAEDWEKLYNPVRVTITPIQPKKRGNHKIEGK